MTQDTQETESTVDLARWRAGIAEKLDWAEDAGYFGPGSAIWQVNRELVIGLGLGRAVLMQLAHPWVSQSLEDHSRVIAHPAERLLATAEAAEVLVFGSRRQADEMACRIRRLHGHIRGVLGEDVGRWRRGDAYRADDPEALLWVLAALVDTALVIYTSCFGRMSRQLEQGYIADAARLGAMLGIPPEIVWPDRPSLDRYIHDRLADGTVQVSDLGTRLAAEFIELSLTEDASRWWRLYTSSMLTLAAATMPKPLTAQFKLAQVPLPYGRYRRLGLLGRLMVRRLPEFLRVDPITAKAMRRGRVSQSLSWG
jgi:uncharacterized protein (DUF2236 family)